MIMGSPAAYLGKPQHIAEESLGRVAEVNRAQGETFATEADFREMEASVARVRH